MRIIRPKNFYKQIVVDSISYAIIKYIGAAICQRISTVKVILWLISLKLSDYILMLQ